MRRSRNSINSSAGNFLESGVLVTIRLNGAGRANARKVSWSVSVVSVATVAAFAGWLILGRVNYAAAQMPGDSQPADKDAANRAARLAVRIIEGLDRNRTKLPNLVYTTEFRAEEKQSTQNSSEPVPVVFRMSGRTVIRGDCIRQEWKSRTEAPGEETVTTDRVIAWQKGKLTEYIIESSPKTRQAWIRPTDREHAFSHLADLRCAGFVAPLKSISDQLRQGKLLDAGFVNDRLGRKAVRLRLILTNRPGETDDMTADFVESQDYMPSRVVCRCTPTGGIAFVIDVDYSKLEPAGAWFPKMVAMRGYVKGTAEDPDAKSFYSSNWMKVLSCDTGSKIGDEEFDPFLPADCILEGELAATNRTGPRPIRASELTLDNPKPLPVPTLPRPPGLPHGMPPGF
jgi:hypothetical protein